MGGGASGGLGGGGTGAAGGGAAGDGGSAGQSGAIGAAGTTETTGAGGVGGRGGTTGTAGMSGATGRGGTTGPRARAARPRRGTTGRGHERRDRPRRDDRNRGRRRHRRSRWNDRNRGRRRQRRPRWDDRNRGRRRQRPPRCAAPADCTGNLTGLTFCSSPSWSCVEGVCVAECRGGRTCREAPDAGCLYCATSSAPQASEGCVTTACAFQPARIRDVQQSNGCQPPNTPDFDTWHCTGNWAVLPGGDRPICTIQMLGTDAVRYSISCGSCITIVTL